MWGDISIDAEQIAISMAVRSRRRYVSSTDIHPEFMINGSVTTIEKYVIPHDGRKYVSQTLPSQPIDAVAAE